MASDRPRPAGPSALEHDEFIGEDSSQHVNNFLRAYNVDTKALSRILSLPAGSEPTGLNAD